jgi:hypothetical protein
MFDAIIAAVAYKHAPRMLAYAQLATKLAWGLRDMETLVDKKARAAVGAYYGKYHTIHCMEDGDLREIEKMALRIVIDAEITLTNETYAKVRTKNEGEEDDGAPRRGRVKTTGYKWDRIQAQIPPLRTLRQKHARKTVGLLRKLKATVTRMKHLEAKVKRDMAQELRAAGVPFDSLKGAGFEVAQKKDGRNFAWALGKVNAALAEAQPVADADAEKPLPLPSE